MRHLVLSAAAFAVALIALATLAVPTEAPAKELALLRPGDDYLLATIDRHQRETWRWQQLMGRPRTPASTVVAGRQWLAKLYLESQRIEEATREYQEIIERQQRYAGWNKDSHEERFLKADTTALTAELKRIRPPT